jgi:thiamine kinase-like enzyme
MDYRDILGLPKKQPKKKVTKKPTKPSITEKLSNEFGPLNEWSEQDTGPKRWTKPFEENMTEFEKEQMNEGPAYEYAGQMKKIEKAENLQAKEVNNLVKLLQSKGMKKEARDLASKYMKSVRDFDSFLKKLERSLI